jgi:hypothetical protein
VFALADKLRKHNIAHGEASCDYEHQQDWQVVVKTKLHYSVAARRADRSALAPSPSEKRTSFEFTKDHSNTCQIENHCTSRILVEVIWGVKQPSRRGSMKQFGN